MGNPFKNEVAKHLTDKGSFISAAMARQIQVIVEGNVCRTSQIWATDYARQYFLGVFDALAAEFPSKVRKKVGPSIVEMGFVHFVCRAFQITEAEARDALKDLLKIQEENPTTSGFVDGYFDGMIMLEEKLATRLLSRLYDIYVGGHNSQK